ncbi:hypothetical protein [Fortiea contorta]|uniref:hypothetical protein n=1 Tax=Fortiea contorta TaxID=1892405 RepID=UPI000346FA38|nr:hypothetical protein [Fortiea contorta]
MSRITISDLAIDSNSFINEVAETEAAFVNGGGLSKGDALTAALGILSAYEKFATAFLKISNKIALALVNYALS